MHGPPVWLRRTNFLLLRTSALAVPNSIDGSLRDMHDAEVASLRSPRRCTEQNRNVIIADMTFCGQSHDVPGNGFEALGNQMSTESGKTG